MIPLRKARTKNTVFVKGLDVLVGVITGAICSVLVVVIETVMAALRVFPVAHVGQAFGDKLAIVALAGALFGGLVALPLGVIVKQRGKAG
ncbi:MAG TPA: hypothetical protein VN603_11330 [Candidatus Acidoferrales bacterium]|jgi:hypothetical protein|nr:hypothetical protein [Candidatus Acidoferrales bacterium]